MPGESGIDFCRRLRADPATAALPIMFVTADVNDHRILAALRAGADDYLTKPFHRTELGTRLETCCGGGTPRRPAPPTRRCWPRAARCTAPGRRAAERGPRIA